jgi:hypothetical protein
MNARLTTLFDEAEDRLDLRLAGGETAGLRVWVTQRLMGRLLPSLFQLLESERAEAWRAARVTAMSRKPAAAGQPATLPPVQAERIGTTILAFEVDVRIGPDLLVMVWRSREGQEISVPFDHEMLGAWLDVLRRAYKLAGWPEPAWPDWMTMDVPTPRNTLALLH